MGDILNGTGGFVPTTVDFILILNNASTVPSASGLFYTTNANTTGFYQTSTVSVTLAAVPEPMTLALLTPALLGLGAARARRRARAAA